MAKDKKPIKFSLQVLLIIVSILSIIGLVFIYSSSCIFASEKFGSSHYFLKKQIFFLMLGIVGFVTFASIPIRFFKKRAPLLFLGSFILVLLTFLPGISSKVHGSNRWLSVAGFGFQPSELLKLFLLVYMGFLFDKKTHKVTSLARVYFPFFFVLAITFLVLLKQPDFGSVVTLFITAMILFFVAGVKVSHLLISIGTALPFAVAAIFLKSYRLNRILVFLNPWADSKGRGYQIIQSLIAIGSGGFWGLGISNSKQKFFYLPMQHTDFIFSIIAEEMGFFGVILIIALYGLFCYFGIKIVSKLKDSFAFFTTLGFIVLITLQSAINLMVVTGLVPTKGLGLPFISYGGSALICNFCMIGLIANFVRESSD
ncbi:putative lipid II flippase FtsW [Candidatus Babeliales bacterium]|nr:putative lipid II flippase FtsW [Candidatus Babeliales bacterium]